jgi:hypothetical protein
LGHEHEWAAGAPHGSFTLNCRKSSRGMGENRTHAKGG